MHPLVLVNLHLPAFEKPLLAKDDHGHRMPLRFSVLGPPHAEEGETKLVSALAGVALGPGDIGWHPGGAGEVEGLARSMLPALSCCDTEIADSILRARLKGVVAEVSHLIVGAQVKQCISLHPPE